MRAAIWPGPVPTAMRSLGGRKAPRMRSAIMVSIWSPAALPSVSLICLKRSQFMNSTAKPPRVAASGRAMLMAICSMAAHRFGICVRPSMRAALFSRRARVSCSRCISAVASPSTAISRLSSSLSRLIDKYFGPAAAASPRSMRNASQMTPVGAPNPLAIDASCGATSASTSNRFCRLASGASGISRFDDIGLSISMVPSRLICTSPIGARYRNWTRAS